VKFLKFVMHSYWCLMRGVDVLVLSMCSVFYFTSFLNFTTLQTTTVSCQCRGFCVRSKYSFCSASVFVLNHLAISFCLDCSWM
jgi:hypothetical protein